jgi:hypothetical protein
MMVKHILLTLVLCAAAAAGRAQPFAHPGLNQSAKDLAHMKQLVLQGKPPWKEAFQRLRASINLDYNVKAHTHVLRGPYGKPNIGGGELSKDAGMAYDCALAWYITGDKAFSDKAIEILNTWSATLWDFDYNDAKLLAAWTGHVLCNAAEILRHTGAGWQRQDVERFTHMLMTVYYPLMRNYYPQANGNWDGAIIHSIMAIAVFTDNRKLFDNALNHFLYAPVNGSVFKYIYPNGQCQESIRDQGHVQLGLGEFAGAAQIAYTQGVDLFSIADNRIALGFEYTAGFLLGEKPYCYGVLSERAKTLRDDYEYVYRHYAAQGIVLPYTKRAADTVRPKAARSVLTAVRAAANRERATRAAPAPGPTACIAGAGAAKPEALPNAVVVEPGQSLQNALNEYAGTGRPVLAKAGVHKLPATLKIPAGIQLRGEGESTVLFLDPASGDRDALVNAAPDMHDVTIRDLVIEGALKTEPGTDPNSSRSFRSNAGNRGGIVFRAQAAGQMKNIRLINLTVRNCTFNGVLISGGSDIQLAHCDLSENGSSVVPGPGLQHNLLLTHCNGIRIQDSRLDTSPFGSGAALSQCRNALVARCEIARNACYGVLLTECSDVQVQENLIENNDQGGVMMEYLYNGNENTDVARNQIHYNGGYGVAAYGARGCKTAGNAYAGNRLAPEKISTEKFIQLNP